MALAEVAEHYEELDVFYREIWGEHVHHGLWRDHGTTPEQAVIALVDYVAALAHIGQGDAVCDIGCGYGATARRLVESYGTQVTALTVTAAQHRFALAVDPGAANPVYLLRDWCENRLAPASFDAAIAIESLSHMTDKQRALFEAARVLKPGGRIVLCVWLAGERPGRWVTRQLLEPICRHGRLAGLATKTEVCGLLQAAGFALDSFEDVSRSVWRTWNICIARALKAVCRDPKYRRYLRDSNRHNREFLPAMIRIGIAYRIGAMRYGVFAAHKI